MIEPFHSTLEILSQRDRRRQLIAANGVDFSSNDYLRLAQHDGIRQSMIRALEGGLDLGAGGSRLLRGNHPSHERLEAFAANFFGASVDFDSHGRFYLIR